MKPNFLLFIALLLIATLLFLNLPEESPYISQKADAASKDVSSELQRMRSDYALMLQEMAQLRTRMEQTQPGPAENRHAGLTDENRADEEGAPGVTIYLDTSKLPAAGNQGQEWTAVGFHDAGRAPDGSKQAVLSITKVNRPQAAQEEPARAVPVSRWH